MNMIRPVSKKSRTVQVSHTIPPGSLTSLPIGVQLARALFLKRPLDIGLSAAGLVLSSPIWLLTTLAILIEDGRPVFFSQRRVGRHGKEFVMIKFRTLSKDYGNKTLGFGISSTAAVQVTRTGKFLRKTAMNELPQLLNILRGDMSFVGPRPEPPEFVEEYEKEVPNFRLLRYQVRPGLTGVAQVYGKHLSPPWRKLRYDLFYIRKRSLWLDLRLIFLSLWTTLRTKWDV